MPVSLTWLLQGSLFPEITAHLEREEMLSSECIPQWDSQGDQGADQGMETEQQSHVMLQEGCGCPKLKCLFLLPAERPQ